MSVPSPIVGQLLGRYRIVEQIGAGGMGVVYRAHDESLDRDVALKVLPAGTITDEARRRRFHAEAKAVAKLNHPNIAMAFDYDHEQDIDFLVTEYAPGVTLDEMLGQGPLPEKTVLELAVQLVSGLEAAHHKNIIHRDLKPGNLQVKSDGQLKILDFGLAKLLHPADALCSTVTLERSFGFKGTIPYMSPEQVRGEAGDQRIDIWATGAVLYEMATGKRAFPQTQNTELIDAIRNEDPVRPSSINNRVSPGLENIILKALDKDPDCRYQTARELHVDLSRLIHGNVTTQDSRHKVLSRYEIRQRKRRFQVTVGGVLALGIVGGFLWHRHVAESGPVRQQIMAVLPFDTVGQNEATSALSLGLTDTLAAKLVQLSTSDSIQLVSPRDLREQGVKTAEQAWREFGTNLVLEGTLEKSGSNLRINCSLVDPKTHRTLGARSITVAETDSFGLQDQVVSEVLTLLPTRIGPSERRELARPPDTTPEAYEAYIRGRGYLIDYDKEENVDSAIAELERATQIDPHYAPSYASLGEAYWTAYEQFNRSKDWLDKAAATCKKAVSLSPDFSEGHTCSGNILFATGNYEESVDQFQRALEIDPGNDYALGQLADAYQKVNKPAAAEAAYKKAIAVRPSYWGVYSGLGKLYFSLARYSEAAEMFNKVTALNPDNYLGYSNLGATYLYLDRYAASITASNRSIELRPNRNAYTNLGAAYFGLRRFADAAKNFQLSLKIDAAEPVDWGNLGDALYWTPSRRHEAAAAYSTAIMLFEAKLRVNPRDPEALGYVAIYSAMLNDKIAAQKNLKDALALAPTDGEVLFDAALVNNHLGDTAEALVWLEKALSAGFPKSQVRDNPEFDNLRSNATFRRFMDGT
jgi:serine/threonine-protein kinase